MIPQFESERTKRADPHLILCGLIIFAIGLFKKTCLADGIQPLVAPAFGANYPSFDQAWIGALAYTFQLYFDFSGYSDMAIGISLMFGIFLPLNFNSPYKATSIIDFWRRLATRRCRSFCATIFISRSAATATAGPYVTST